MQFPLPTGQVARLLGTTEPKLAETVRRGRVRPSPPILAGRRLWQREHIEQAAEALGVPTADLDSRLDAGAPLATHP